MIAVDTSALLAIVLDEPEARDFMDFLLFRDCMIGMPTLLEAHVALGRFRSDNHIRALDFMIQRPNLEKIAFGEDHCRLARAAHDLYGKRTGHPASLNLGDCLSYAIAKVHGLPLLYKGDDFIHTDIEPAWRP